MNKIIKLTDGWTFCESGKSLDSVNVTVPHTVRVEPLETYYSYQGNFVYTREFVFDHTPDKENTFLKFEGVQTVAKVYFNGKHLTTHFGGYLPFVVDISKEIKIGKNLLTVNVNNRDDREIPPGKPTEGLDFLYYGGIYREVYLIQKGSLYISDNIEGKDCGIKILTKKELCGYSLSVFADLKNTGTNFSGNINFSIHRGSSTLSIKSISTEIMANSSKTVVFSELIHAPLEWSPDFPNLYKLKISFSKEGDNSTYDEIFGFKDARVTDEGYLLNGKKITLFGVNRHQQFPYIGIAASAEAHRREARLLKDNGINCVRLSHYPQHTSFLDECDKVGIICIDPVPGWQFVGNKLWKTRLKENLLDMVRRDRNHPCCQIFEITPNESHWITFFGDTYFKKLNLLLKREMPTALTSGDTQGRYNAKRIKIDIPHVGNDIKNGKKLYSNHEKAFLKREHGDWSFGGNRSSSRVKRGDGELKMQLQAWNFQWSRNQAYIDDYILGDLIWEGIDHNRGYFKDMPISTSGILDIFRLPKFSASFVKSQKKTIINKNEIVLSPAFHYYKQKNKLVIYSNCEEVCLFGEETLLKRQKPDCGKTDFFVGKNNADDNYWANGGTHKDISENMCTLAAFTYNCLYNGNNTENVNPPFTFFDLSLNDYSFLKIVGYIDGKICKDLIFRESSPFNKLSIEISDNGIPLSNNNNDFIFVYVKALDENSNISLCFNSEVVLSVENGDTIYTDRILAEEGIASFLIKANQNATVVNLTATAGNFTSKFCYKL